MGNEFRGLSGHSADWFGDTRDHWWNEDFIALQAQRWRLHHARDVLDVGCGVGHWGRLLARILSPSAHIVGLDREAEWVRAATARAQARGGSERFSYRVGIAEALPFAVDAFDVVTCQTLLMHVPDPATVLAEMVRVARPGGLVLVAEPTDVAGGLLESMAVGDALEISTTLLRFELTCAHGKTALGEGNSLIGESLPALLVAAGLQNVDIRNNDRAWSLTPPCAMVDVRAEIEERTDSVVRARWIWDEQTTRRYFEAGRGDSREFPELWQAALDRQKRVLDAIHAGTFQCAGGSLFYLAWGFKPTGSLPGAVAPPTATG